MVVSDELADFGAFYERTYRRTFAIAFGMTGDPGMAEDVTQDAYVAAFRQRAGYRAEGPVEAWLYRIVVNAATSALRRRPVRFLQPLMPGDDPPGPRDPASASLDRITLAEGLQRLDPRARSIVILRYYLDLDYESIGRIVGASPGNVGAILTRSRDRLAALIGADDGPAGGREPAIPRVI